MTITATQVLTLLNKATRLGATYDVNEYNDGFGINIYYNWEPYEYYHYTVFITNEDESTLENGWDFTFDSMMEILDENLKELAEKEIKENKRKELIDSLTPEQRELLDL